MEEVNIEGKKFTFPPANAWNWILYLRINYNFSLQRHHCPLNLWIHCVVKVPYWLSWNISIPNLLLLSMLFLIYLLVALSSLPPNVDYSLRFVFNLLYFWLIVITWEDLHIVFSHTLSRFQWNFLNEWSLKIGISQLLLFLEPQFWIYNYLFSLGSPDFL